MMKRLLPYSLMAILIAVYFYFDRGLMIGCDNAYFLDMSFLLSRGGRFLLDFFDYRFPVLPLIFSPIFNLGFSDFVNRYILLVGVYSFYSFVIYFAAYLVSRSKRTALIISMLTFISIAARQYDGGRHICFPLFSHTLELLSVTILLSIFLNIHAGIDSGKSKWYALASGVFFALAFISRQIHFVSPIIMGALIGLLFLLREKRNIFRDLSSKDIRGIVFFYCFGFVASFGALGFFLVPKAHSFSLIKTWLFDFPQLFYPHSLALGWILARIKVVFLEGLSEWRNKILPIFGITYFALFVSVAALFFNRKEGIFVRLKKMFIDNLREIVFILFIAVIAISPAFVLSISRRSDPGFFSLYAILLAYLSNKFLFGRKALKIAIISLPILFYICFLFLSRELPSYMASIKLMNTEKYDGKVAKAIIRAAKGQKKYVVLALCGHPPTVVRLTGYTPFMGLIGDGGYYALPKLFGKKYEIIIREKLREVDIVYKGFDYPNLSFGSDGDTKNSVYLMFERYLRKYFRILEIVPQKGIYPNNDCYPFRYDWSLIKNVQVYKRVLKDGGRRR